MNQRDVLKIASSFNLWWLRSESKQQPYVRLFCFPYAGGGPSIFNGWQRMLGPHFEVCSLCLPGRTPRLQEPICSSLSDIVANIYKSVQTRLDVPFCFFGHSMGALIAFEVARKLWEKGDRLPHVLFVSGSRAPQIARFESKTYDLPTDQFIAEVGRLNGTPREVLANEQLMELLLPCLRADFQICQTYVYSSECRLPVPIHVFGGTEDHETSPNQLQGWGEQTTRGCSMTLIKGDHFFINTSQEALLSSVKAVASYQVSKSMRR